MHSATCRYGSNLRPYFEAWLAEGTERAPAAVAPFTLLSTVPEACSVPAAHEAAAHEAGASGAEQQLPAGVAATAALMSSRVRVPRLAPHLLPACSCHPCTQ